MSVVSTTMPRLNLFGAVISRGHSFNGEQRTDNGMIDAPPLTRKCSDIADVIAAVNLARNKGLRVVIRGGGQDGPEGGAVADALVIDTSSVKGGTACRKALRWIGLT